jgi:alkylation response protein AidB-like acyl-CoA dehydrogenase
MAIPRNVGGFEPEVLSILETIKEIATADGSAGWVTMIYATSSVGAHYLSDDALAEVYAPGPDVLVAGVLAPRGTVSSSNSGITLSGRWPFASGSVDADWISLGALDPGGRLVSLILPMSDVEVIDTWDVIGLRATASHDVAVRDCPIPEHRVFDLSGPPNTTEAPARFPIYGLLAAGIGAVCLGIARSAIDQLIDLAGAKIPTGSKRRLADRGAVQEAVARAEAMVGAATLYLFDSAAVSSFPATSEERARLRAAATHAVDASRQAIDLMYGLAGGSAVYAGSRLQRHLRDIHTATQHMMVAQPTWELAGRVMLGMETDTSQL